MSLDEGDAEGVVFAKNMIGPPVVPAACDVNTAKLACGADPCFCASPGSQVVGDVLTLDPNGTATLPFADWSRVEPVPAEDEPHDDAWYSDERSC